MSRVTLPRYFGHSISPFFISYESISEVKDYYLCMEYSAVGIVMDTKRIYHRKSGLKLVPIMQVFVTFGTGRIEDCPLNSPNSFKC